MSIEIIDDQQDPLRRREVAIDQQPHLLGKVLFGPLLGDVYRQTRNGSTNKNQLAAPSRWSACAISSSVAPLQRGATHGRATRRAVGWIAKSVGGFPVKACVPLFSRDIPMG